MPRLCLTDTRGVIRDTDFRAGSLHLRSHGCPDPDRGIVRARRPRKGSQVPGNTVRPTPTPVSAAAHARNVERVYARMLEAQASVKAARAAGDETARQAAARHARECRADWMRVSGTVLEGREIAVDLGSETSPVRAV